MRSVMTLAAVVVLGAVVSAQTVTKPSSASLSVSGTWTVSMVNRAEPVVLDIKVNGSAISGTFAGSAVEGEVADGKLTWADPTSWAAWRAGTIGSNDGAVMYPTVVFASLKEDGTLSGWTDVFIRGYGPQAIKRLSWTATRSKSK